MKPRDEKSAPNAPASVIGLAALAKMAFVGADLEPVRRSLIERGLRDPGDAAAFMDLSLLELFQGRETNRRLFQNQALESRRVFRNVPAFAGLDNLRVLALAAPGNLMANTPIEFLVERSDVVLDTLYLLPGQPLPDPPPDHDVAFVAVAEGPENESILSQLADRLRTWPRPVLNDPAHIRRLTRDGAAELLASVPGAIAPVARRLDRAALAGFDAQDRTDGLRTPFIVRPFGSHAGEGLEKIDEPGAISAYLAAHRDENFFVSNFVDYKSPDGYFRKYRIAFVGGRAFPCHMAVSSRWMIHYLNADMLDSAPHRAEEAHFLEDFDAGFGAQHRGALDEIARRCGLDYLVMDCGETNSGALLIFEVGNAMIVHAMDPADVFPYKAEPMRRLFSAFQAMLRARARG